MTYIILYIVDFISKLFNFIKLYGNYINFVLIIIIFILLYFCIKKIFLNKNLKLS